MINDILVEGGITLWKNGKINQQAFLLPQEIVSNFQ